MFDSQTRTSTTVPDEPRNDRAQHNTDFTKDVLWHGLSGPRRAPLRPGEVLGVDIHARAFYRTCPRIELPWPDFFWPGRSVLASRFLGFCAAFAFARSRALALVMSSSPFYNALSDFDAPVRQSVKPLCGYTAAQSV